MVIILLSLVSIMILRNNWPYILYKHEVSYIYIHIRKQFIHCTKNQLLILSLGWWKSSFKLISFRIRIRIHVQNDHQILSLTFIQMSLRMIKFSSFCLKKKSYHDKELENSMILFDSVWFWMNWIFGVYVNYIEMVHLIFQFKS